MDMDANELVSAIKALINNLENAQEDRDEWKKLYRASEYYGEKQQARAEAAEAECERLREAAIAYDNEHEPDEYGLKWGAHVSERAYLAFVAAFGIDENTAGG